MTESHASAAVPIIEIVIDGPVTYDDATAIADRVQQVLARHDRVCALYDIRHFEGVDATAAWVGVDFGLRHMGRIARIAVTGDWPSLSAWADEVPTVNQTRTRYFDREEIDEARRWLAGELAPQSLCDSKPVPA